MLIVSVTSSLPVGLALGPALFLLFINDLPECVNCAVSLFDDHTLLNQELSNSRDTDTLDLDSLRTWAARGSMEYVSKSKILFFKPTISSTTPSYTLNGKAMEQVAVADCHYLGDTIR